MRLAPLPRDRLSSEQQSLDQAMREGIKAYLQGFVSERPDGALIGPFERDGFMSRRPSRSNPLSDRMIQTCGGSAFGHHALCSIA